METARTLASFNMSEFYMVIDSGKDI